MKNKPVIAFDLDGTLGDIQTNVLYADIERLKMLKNEYRIGLVTGSPLEEVRGLIPSFPEPFDADLTVTIESTGQMKATGKPFEELLKRTGKTGVVFIGDSGSDEEGCRKVGLPFIRVFYAPETTVQERTRILNGKIGEAKSLLANDHSSVSPSR